MLKRFHLNLYFNNLFIVNILIFYFGILRKIKFALIFCILTLKWRENGVQKSAFTSLFFVFLLKIRRKYGVKCRGWVHLKATF